MINKYSETLSAKSRPMTTKPLFECNGNVFSERKIEEEKKGSFALRPLALGPAWYKKGDCESGRHGGEQENREKDLGIGEEKICSLEVHTSHVFSAFSLMHKT